MCPDRPSQPQRHRPQYPHPCPLPARGRETRLHSPPTHRCRSAGGNDSAGGASICADCKKQKVIPAPSHSHRMPPSLRRRACDEQVASGGSLVGQCAQDPLVDHRLVGAGSVEGRLHGGSRTDSWAQIPGQTLPSQVHTRRCGSARSFVRSPKPPTLGRAGSSLNPCGLTASSRRLAQAALAACVL